VTGVETHERILNRLRVEKRKSDLTRQTLGLEHPAHQWERGFRKGLEFAMEAVREEMKDG